MRAYIARDIELVADMKCGETQIVHYEGEHFSGRNAVDFDEIAPLCCVGRIGYRLHFITVVSDLFLYASRGSCFILAILARI